ncbi:hypothetical protein A3D00_03595 [Candidatus Woesebacteria bacterium RIFCSPHIGHO2_02_FULL_38_9]|uniref:Uncharacterized protein n=1 Tax=Candidatus Woesebacteria bacterium RIFCSPHIGHO2_01_FULL_39_28 TaxID=1802496 RepID=A0A1F7YI57_9BACT|nr:MAG: hypothetical protein A2627_00920 [Candidatus Woesebacteria bacterium RIFCSPHIGHO2_01_FULL_39_28]OGM32578.1 MAG: hypothetical protein A3D00_03595 [Candidatus Woesebacteria bacterium RIFCSPHIGHO2_02_FULL_38_9]OGM58722.1 MAG: hypothetical protein A3A50_02940 [Candidatus Woesebacteria bacterium RIFCSPLOWO2_01_FULL_38_20]
MTSIAELEKRRESADNIRPLTDPIQIQLSRLQAIAAAQRAISVARNLDFQLPVEIDISNTGEVKIVGRGS